MRPIAIMVTGDPIARVRATRGTYADIFRKRIGARFEGPVIEVEVRDGSPLPSPDSLRGVIITGSSSSVTERAPWMLRAESFLREVARERIPTLGVCFGHQLLGQALGGDVQRNPAGREIGTVDLELQLEDALFSGLPAPHRVNATHVDSVVRLPSGARVIARTRLEPNAAVRFNESTWGVQFHPEIDADIMRAFLEERRELIAREGLDPQALLEAVEEAEAGASVLDRFVELVTSSA